MDSLTCSTFPKQEMTLHLFAMPFPLHPHPCTRIVWQSCCKSMACTILFSCMWWCWLYSRSGVLSFQETWGYQYWLMIELSHMVLKWGWRYQGYVTRGHMATKGENLPVDTGCEKHPGLVTGEVCRGSFLYQAPYSSNCTMISSKAYNNPNRKLSVSHCIPRED